MNPGPGGAMARFRILSFTTLLGFFLARCGGNPEVGTGGETGGKPGGGGGQAGDASAGQGPVFGGAGGRSACEAGTCGGAPADSGDASDGSTGPYCGDGLLLRGTETCDDGNATPGDGCSATCQLEANYVCSNPGSPCVPTVACGDGTVGGNEQCDDHNKV